MATNLVNLDALIPREDFEVEQGQEPAGLPVSTVQIRDLEKTAFFYDALRKPDFRVANHGSSSKKIVMRLFFGVFSIAVLS